MVESWAIFLLLLFRFLFLWIFLFTKVFLISCNDYVIRKNAVKTDACSLLEACFTTWTLM